MGSSTHDWSSVVDHDHVRHIRDNVERFAPGGAMHLVLEAMAYPVDEAVFGTTDRMQVTMHRDGSISVADNGRGTQTRYDELGVPTVKPVMGTKDLRFFDDPDSPALPDGHRRFGMSVVASLSQWLTHINIREGHAWTRRYAHGQPQGSLMEIDPPQVAGTIVRFHPDMSLLGAPERLASAARSLCVAWESILAIEVIEEAAA